MLEIAQSWTIKQDGTELTVVDATGVYDVNNTGGYGNPNDDRVDFAIVFYPKYINHDTPFELMTVTSNIYKDGNLGLSYSDSIGNDFKSSFTLELTKDGVVDLNMIAVPVTPSVDQDGIIKYNPTSGLLEIYSGGGYGELTDFELLLDPVQLLQANCSEIIMNRTLAGKRVAMNNYLKLRGKDCTERWDFWREHWEIEMAMVSAFNNHRSGRKLLAQEELYVLDDIVNNM